MPLFPLQDSLDPTKAGCTLTQSLTWQKMTLVGGLKEPRSLFSQHIHFTGRWVFWNALHTVLCTLSLSELKEVLFWKLLSLQLTVQVDRAVTK